MKAIVLVGGFGTRLRPLTLTTPKQMLSMVDRPMIEHVVGHLAKHGVSEVILSLGYRPDAFSEAYPGGACAGVRLAYAVEPEPLDTAGAIRFAAHFAGVDQRVLVLNGDVLTDIDVSGLVEAHIRMGGEGTIALTPVDDPSRFGVVPIDNAGRVLDFVEKPPPGTAPTNWINAGIYVLEPDAIARIHRAEKVSIERVTFPEMVSRGTLFARQDASYWVDAGTPEAFLRASIDLVSGARAETLAAVAATSAVSPDADLSGSVVMAGAVVMEGATVTGSVLMEDSIVGVGAVVSGSIIGRRSMVSDGARVEDLTVTGDGTVVLPGERLSGARVSPPAAEQDNQE